MNTDTKSGAHRAAFVEYLLKLVEDDDRAALAALRSGIGRPHPPAAMCQRMRPFVRVMRPGSWQEQSFYLVGALFAMHPGGTAEKVSLGNAFAKVMRGDQSTGNTELRFRALLDTDPGALHLHLRQAVDLMYARSVVFDWTMLLMHVEHWGDKTRWVQWAWARDFWTPPKATTDENKENAATAA